MKTWGSQTERTDWFSSAKSVLSTLLKFALREGKVKSVDQPIRDFGWALKPKDREAGRGGRPDGGCVPRDRAKVGAAAVWPMERSLALG